MTMCRRIMYVSNNTAALKINTQDLGCGVTHTFYILNLQPCTCLFLLIDKMANPHCSFFTVQCPIVMYGITVMSWEVAEVLWQWVNACTEQEKSGAHLAQHKKYRSDRRKFEVAKEMKGRYDYGEKK